MNLFQNVSRGSLTWRDVQHLIIRSSEPEKVKLNNADSWIINGANLKGILNAICA